MDFEEFREKLKMGEEDFTAEEILDAEKGFFERFGGEDIPSMLITSVDGNIKIRARPDGSSGNPELLGALNSIMEDPEFDWASFVGTVHGRRVVIEGSQVRKPKGESGREKMHQLMAWTEGESLMRLYDKVTFQLLEEIEPDLEIEFGDE